jgi:tripartite-type tricarboxylate transporter receptor subunit TctC
MRVLAVVNPEPVDTLPNVPAITDTLPKMEKFLPWGPFYGVFVRSDVPNDVKAKLTSVFEKAATDKSFVDLMANRGNVIMNMTGKEAVDFLAKWQQVTVWALEDTGAAKVSPKKLGISRP